MNFTQNDNEAPLRPKEQRMSSWTVHMMKITCTLEPLQKVMHETQIGDDRGVMVPKREESSILLLEECSSAPPCDLEE